MNNNNTFSWNDMGMVLSLRMKENSIQFDGYVMNGKVYMITVYFCDLKQEVFTYNKREKDISIYNKFRTRGRILDDTEMESVDLSNMTTGCCDLSPNGTRWEGDILDGLPFGFGYCYDEDNHLSFSGYCFGKNIFRVGTFIYASSGKPQFQGVEYKEKRVGSGYFYDRNGFVSNAHWISGILTKDFMQRDVYVTEVDIPKEKEVNLWDPLKMEMISVEDNDSIEVFQAGDGSCLKVGGISFAYCDNLTSIRISSRCFISDLEILSCPRLEEVTIGPCCFPKATLLKLQSIFPSNI